MSAKHITPPYTLRGTHIVKLTGTPATVFIAELVDCRPVDAEFIVQACNAYGELLAALKKIATPGTMGVTDIARAAAEGR
jgi:hypothetical protein